MGIFSHWPLQKAVYQALTADAALMAIVNGVYDFVPASAAYPYAVIGEMTGADRSTKTTGGMEFRFFVRVFSREGGRKQAASAMERIHAVLHHAALSVTGQTLVSLRCEGSEIRLEDDGATYQGILRFRAALEG